MEDREHQELLAKINTTPKPIDFIIDDLKWKYLLWSVLKSKNVLLVGPTRCGKTQIVKSVAKVLDRDSKFFKFNLGSTQDARSTLIGNTFVKKEEGTIFFQSEFVRAIQTKNAIILLDEITRGHHDAWNILMSVIDPTQKYLRLDEAEDSTIIPVDKSVTFVATANIGMEYTATKVLDKAISARFPVKIEMNPLSCSEEMILLKIKFPGVGKKQTDIYEQICKIAEHTREMCKLDDSPITTFIPTGTVIEMAELVNDGFTLLEIAQMVIYPDYVTDGGMDSERTYMKQLVQKYVSTGILSPINDPTVR